MKVQKAPVKSRWLVEHMYDLHGFGQYGIFGQGVKYGDLG